MSLDDDSDQPAPGTLAHDAGPKPDAPGGSVKKRGCLRGLLIGCGVLVLLSFALVIAAVRHLIAGEPLGDPMRFVGPSHETFAVVELNAEHTRAVELVHKVAEQLAQAQDAPPEVRARARQFRADRFMPLRLTLLVEIDQTQRVPKWLTVLSIGRCARLARLVFWVVSTAARTPDGPVELVETYKGHPVLAPGRPNKDERVSFTLVGNDLIFSSGPKQVKEALDRLATAEPPLPAPEIEQMRHRVSTQFDAYGVFSNNQGQVDWLFDKLREAHPKLKPVDFSSVNAMGWDAELTEGDNVRLRFHFACDDVAAISGLHEQLEEAAKSLADSDKKWSCSSCTRDRATVTAIMQLTGASALVAGRLQATQGEKRDR